MNMPTVSVIMPAYNCEKYINEAIDSILNQTYADFELLIADDGSTDNTKTIIDHYSDPRIKKYHNKKNLGYLKTSNILITHCKGRFISFQDADDSSVFNRLELLLKEFAKNSNLCCAGTYVNRINEDSTYKETISFKNDYKSIKADLPYFFNCVGSALMVKKEVIDNVGLYENYFDRCGSEDLYWYGIVAKKFETINIPMPLYNYRSTPNSISNEVKKSPKKQMSNEIAVKGLEFFYRTGKSIFKNRYRLSVLEKYLIGKGLCWQTQYKQGVKLIVTSVLMNPFIYSERYKLLRIYVPKLIK